MSKTACKQCPFRKGSAFCYDADAMESLQNFNTPACHMLAGVDAVFAHAPMNPPEEHECVGHQMWLEDHPDFDVPAVKQVMAT